MKKSILSLLAMVAVGATVQAAPRSLSEAQAFAQQFLSQQIGQSVQLSSLNQRMQAPGINAESAVQPYYAFNDADNQAFVIVSGSDLMRPIIGYSTTGTLPESLDQMPDNMRSWFEWLEQASAYVEQHPEAALSAQQRSQTFEPIQPLMKSKWGQDAPYNAQCPTGCPTGCVATATAQIFRYHFAKLGEVVQGIGSHSYTYRNKTRTVNYSDNTYDYSKMPLNGRNATATQKSELAKFCYHIGVGVDMYYDASGSGTLSSFIPRLAIENFGFNSLTSYILREMYSYDEWVSILNNELQNERPIAFGGQSATGGHAFVLEGLDAQGLYYVNWGWDGYMDGYFDVTVLNSGDAGTGATASEDGFCMQQDAVVNLCFEEGAGKYYSPMQIGSYGFTSSKSSVTKGQSVTITAQNIINYVNVEQSGYCGLVLMQGDQEILRTENSNTVSAYPATRSGYYGTGQVKRTITFDESLADGTYQLWMYYQPKGKDYYGLLHTTHTKQSYFTVVVEGNSVKISRPQLEVSVVPTSWTWDTEQIETRPTTLTCNLYNPGDESFVAQYQLTLIDPDGQRMDPINTGKVYIVAPGETQAVSFDYHFTKAGHWKAEMDFIRQNFSENPEPFEEADGEFDVVVNETMGAVFQMTKAIEQVSDTVYLNREATFRLKLKNTGAPYNGQIGIRFFSKTSSTKATSEFFCDATFAEGTEDTIELTGMIKDLKEKTKYYARPYYLFGDEYAQIESKTGVSGYLQVAIYPEPQEEQGIADITVDGANDLAHAQIYNIVGKRVTLPANGQLPRGIYIIDGKKTVIK